MDSVTQFVLGAAVSTAFLGRRIGPRRAAILGGLMGTVPDLDTFLPATDPVEAFVSHRGATHSLLMHAVATPLFAEPLVRLINALRDQRVRVYIAVYLVFATHALIDAMTVYGTQLLWPFGAEPVGVGSIFIIDPLYTVPLLVMTLWALFIGNWTDRFGRWLTVSLAVTAVYMGATIPIQQNVQARATALLAEHGITSERLLAILTPFNVAYWKVLAIDGDRYINMYMPAFGSNESVTTYVHPRRADLVSCLLGNPAFQKLTAFTDGFYSLADQDGRVVFTDLRMGLTPAYAFRFEIAEIAAGVATPLSMPVRLFSERNVSGNLDWLQAGVLQAPISRLAEISAEVAMADVEPTENQVAMSGCTIG